MNIFKYFGYITKGIAIMSALTIEIPTIVADGKVTVDEIVALFKKVCEIGGWSMIIDVPASVANEIVTIK